MQCHEITLHMASPLDLWLVFQGSTNQNDQTFLETQLFKKKIIKEVWSWMNKRANSINWSYSQVILTGSQPSNIDWCTTK